MTEFTEDEEEFRGLRVGSEIGLVSTVIGFSADYILTRSKHGRTALVPKQYADLAAIDDMAAPMSALDERIIEAATQWRAAYGKYDFDDNYFGAICLRLRDAVDAKLEAERPLTRREKIREAIAEGINAYGISDMKAERSMQEYIADAIEEVLGDE